MKYLGFLLLFLGSFTFTQAQTPANDNCSGAILLSVNSDNQCTLTTNGTTVGATTSMPSCSFTVGSSDVWFKFTATQSSHKILVTAGTIQYPAFQVLSGNCSGLTAMVCVDNSFAINGEEKTTLSGLTIGNEYFIRVYSGSNQTSAKGTFTICIGVPVPPINDNCSNPTQLTVNQNQTCSITTSSTTEDATESLPACQVGSQAQDVWFAFTATSTVHNLVLTPGTLQLGSMELFSGTCGNLQSIYCKPAFEANTLKVGELEVGQTYLIRVHSYYGAAQGGTFSLCVNEAIGMPANDRCSAAIALTANSSSCAIVTSGDVENASGKLDATCVGDPIRNDVWFKFTATASDMILNLRNHSLSSPLLELFSGTCGSLNQIKCSEGGYLAASGLIIGQEYFVRVWNRYAVFAGQGSFNICLSGTLVNDHVTQAVALQYNNNTTCNLITSGDNTLALGPDFVSNAFCGTVNNGLWYKFTAANDSLEINMSSTGINSGVMELFYNNGGTPEFLTFNNSKIKKTDFIIGQEYFILIYSCGNYSTLRGSFELCLKNLPPPPQNDNCSGAIAISVNNDYSCDISTNGTTINALGVEPTTCGNVADDDVWYKFTATASSHLIKVAGNSMVNPAFQVFSGTCGTLNQIGCHDNTCCGDPEEGEVNGLMIDQEYFIQVSSSDLLNDEGTFSICVRLPTPIPANDDCENAEIITAGVCTNGSNVNIQSTNYDGCAEFEKRNVWYQFTAPASSMSLTLTRGSIQNVAIDVWQGGCSETFSFNSCDIGSNDAEITKNISGLNIGQVYYITISTRETYEEGTFTLCLNSLAPPSNNLCENAQNLSMNGPSFSTNFTGGTTQFADGDLLACNETFMARDVWYTFTATQSTHLVFLKTGSLFAGKFEVFSGNCNNLNSIFCSTNNFTNSDYSSQEVTGLTPGQVYKIRVFSEANNGTLMGSFNIAVAEMQAFDECEGAENLVYNSDNAIVVLENKSLTMVSRSNNVDCFGNGDTGEIKDVWFKFIPNTSSALIYFKALGSGAFYSFSLQKGSCGSLSCLGIAGIGSFTDTLSYQIKNLQIGANYFVRIRYSGALKPNSFGIFVKAYADPKCKNAGTLILSNRDNPVFKADSIHLNPDPNYSILLTPVDSVVVLNPSICNPENANWYKFIPQSANQMLWLETFVLNAQYSIKTGTCDNLSTYSDCEEVSPGKVKNLTNLQIGQDYYLVLGAQDTDVANNLSFGNVQIGMSNTNAPANEICNNALTLNICNSGDSCRTQKFYSNLSSATSSSTCTSQSGSTVWFKFVATGSSVNAILENLTFDAYVDLFEGSCSTLQLLGCNLQGGALNNIFEMSNLQIGATYFLKVYSPNPLLFKINLVKPGKNDSYPFQDQGCLGVNLVTDPGFEKHSSCPSLFVPTPSTPGQLLATGSEWTIPSTGSSDLFSSCAAFEATIDVPRNPTFGIQYPFAGKSYAGFFASANGYREYLKHTLSDSLQPGKTYLLSMYTSKADYEGLAQNGLGFGLSVNSHIFNGNTVILTDTAIIATGNPIVSNSEKWIRLTATFTADKKYKHVYLGSFRTQANSQSQITRDLSGGIYGGYDGRGSVNLRSYYFVDEVFVGELKDQIACAVNPCSQNVVLVSPQDNILNANVQKITNQEIKANITIQGNSNVLFNSGKSILINGQNGVFEVKSGVVFEAKIGGCEN